MNEVIAALEERLEATGCPVRVSDATGERRFPYTLLLLPGFANSDEIALDGRRVSVGDTLMVRPVALNSESLFGLQQRTRLALTDQYAPLTILTATYRVALAWDGSQPVTVDRDVTDTVTNTHPVYVTDEYTLAVDPR